MTATLENNQHAKYLKIEVRRAFNYQPKPLFKIINASSEPTEDSEMKTPQKYQKIKRKNFINTHCVGKLS